MMIRKTTWRDIVLIAAAALLCGARAQGQTNSGTLSGYVVDRTHGSVAGARIEVAGPARKSTSSDASGAFRVTGLPPGKYAVQASKERFAPAVQSAEIVPGQLTTLEIQLALAPVQEQITVNEETGLGLDARDSAGAIVLREKDLDALPDDPDEMAEALQALAGPAAGPDGGQIFIDGFSGGRLPPKASIREIRINANPFSAEFDRVGFGRIEILTKPGTDKLRGDLSFGFNDESLNSRNPYAPNRPPFQRRDYEAEVSGTLIPKKVSYEVEIDRRDTDDNALINATVLDQDLNVVPYSQAVLTPQERTSGGARLDIQLGSKHTLVMRYSYSESARPQSGIGEYSLLSRAFKSTSHQQSLRATETMIINETTVNETRVQYAWNRSEQTGDNSVPSLQVLDAFTGGGAQVGRSSSRQAQLELHNVTSWVHGSHTLRAGVRVQGVRVDDVSTQNFGGSVTFSGGVGPALDANDQPVLDAAGAPVLTQLTSIERYRRTVVLAQLGLAAAEIRAMGGGASQLSIAGGNPEAEVSQWTVAPFVQDEWRLNRNTTLSLGLRYENQTNISSSWNLAPRVSLAWAPRKKDERAKTVLRAGFGVFYDRISENLTMQAERFDGVSQQQYLVTDPLVLDQLQFSYAATRNLPSTAALDAFRQPQNIRRVADDIQTPVTYQASVSIDRSLPAGFTATANLLATWTRRMLRSRNINAPLPGTGERPLGTAEAVYQYESTGRLNQRQLILGLNNRLSRSLTLFARYFYGHARSDTDGAGSFPSNQWDTSADWGPAGMDVRHRFTLGGSVTLPGNVRVSPFVIASSGSPYNITAGRDVNGDTVYTDRPAYATDPTRTSVVQTPYGLLDTDPLPGATIIPRNLGRGPSFVVVNLRINKSISLKRTKAAVEEPQPGGPEGGPGAGGPPPGMGGGPGGPGGGGHDHGGGGMRGGGGGMRGRGGQQRPSLSLGVSVQNLFNHVNAGPPVGNLSSALFGQSLATAGGFGFGRGGGPSAAGNRRIDLQARLDF